MTRACQWRQRSGARLVARWEPPPWDSSAGGTRASTLAGCWHALIKQVFNITGQSSGSSAETDRSLHGNYILVDKCADKAQLPFDLALKAAWPPAPCLRRGFVLCDCWKQHEHLQAPSVACSYPSHWSPSKSQARTQHDTGDVATMLCPSKGACDLTAARKASWKPWLLPCMVH